MSRILYLSERASGSADSPLDTYIPAFGSIPALPYISTITDGLYVGGVNPTLLLPPWIEYVVSMHPIEYRTIQELDGFASFKAADSKSQDPAVFLTASAVATEFWKRGPTLIHCQAGLNRGPTVAALSIMARKGISSRTAIQMLRDRRSPAVLFNKTFEDFVNSQDPPAADPSLSLIKDTAQFARFSDAKSA